MATWVDRLDAALGTDDLEAVAEALDTYERDPEIARMLDDLFSGRAQCVRGPNG